MAGLSDAQIASLLNSGASLAELPPELEQALAKAVSELVNQAASSSSLSPFLSNVGLIRRFLIARKLKVPETIEMLEHHAAWRERTLPITLSESLVKELRKGKCYVHGRDCQGRPMATIRSCNFDPKTRDLDEAIRAVIYLMDAAMPENETEQFGIFYDRSNFSLGKNLDMALIKGVVSALSDNYPERLGAVYIYPAGAVVNMVWKVVGPFMDPRTRSKVRIVTSEAMLATLVPPEHLPTRYGGTSTFEFDPSVYTVAAAAAPASPGDGASG